MGKSVLIIKTPESCEKCQLCVNVLGKHYCAAKGTHIAKGERDCSCPLVAVPTVEAVPVVRCKNCKHWGTGVAGETEHVKCCEYGKYMVGENGYCVYGEKV